MFIDQRVARIHHDLIKAQLDVGEDKKSTKVVKNPTPPVETCNQELLVKMGLEGLESPIETKLSMCPSVTHSCCKLTDQIKMHDQWVKKEGPRLEKNLKVHEKVYKDLLDIMALVDAKSRVVRGKTDDPENECLIVSNAIEMFQIGSTVETIQAKLELHYKSLLEFYKGVYCTLCDLNSHNHIHVNTKEIVLSERSCRDFVGSSLKFLTYFHSHIPKILNILNLFIMNCDADANYTNKAIPPQYSFDIPSDLDTLLIDTIEKRNEPGWLQDFTKICTRTKITEITAFMMPNLKKFEAYVQHIRSIIISSKVNSNSAMTLPSPEPQTPTPATTQPDKPQDDKPNENPEPIINVYEPFKVFDGSFKDLILLDELKIKIAETGIDFTSIAKSTKFDEEALKQVGIDIKIEKGELEPVADKKKAVAGNAAGLDSGIGIYTGLYNVITVVLVLWTVGLLR